MTLNDILPASPFAADDKTQRTCGGCLERKPVTEFYKDGVDGEGETKYRRNCKDCYRITRLKADRAKKEASRPAPRTKTRRKKK
jgi:hypothetical protein